MYRSDINTNESNFISFKLWGSPIKLNKTFVENTKLHSFYEKKNDISDEMTHVCFMFFDNLDIVNRKTGILETDSKIKYSTLNNYIDYSLIKHFVYRILDYLSALYDTPINTEKETQLEDELIARYIQCNCNTLSNVLFLFLLTNIIIHFNVHLEHKKLSVLCEKFFKIHQEQIIKLPKNIILRSMFLPSHNLQIPCDRYINEMTYYVHCIKKLEDEHSNNKLIPHLLYKYSELQYFIFNKINTLNNGNPLRGDFTLLRFL